MSVVYSTLLVPVKHNLFDDEVPPCLSPLISESFPWEGVPQWREGRGDFHRPVLLAHTAAKPLIGAPPSLIYPDLPSTIWSELKPSCQV